MEERIPSLDINLEMICAKIIKSFENPGKRGLGWTKPSKSQSSRDWEGGLGLTKPGEDAGWMLVVNEGRYESRGMRGNSV